MSEFPDVPLGSLFSNVTGGGTPPRQVAEYWNGPIPWASVKDFKEGTSSIESTQESITKIGLGASTSKLIKSGTPLICLRMAVGRTALIKRDIAINQDVKALFPESDIDPSYVCYLLKFVRDKVESRAIGSTVKGITTAELLKIPVPFPEQREQQKKIAKILTTVDNLIEKTQALINKYTAIKQGMMADLFTRGIDLSGTPDTNLNYGQLRPSYEEAPELYKKTELGWVPKEWSIYTFGELADYKNGASFTAEDWKEEGLPIIRIQNLNGSDEYNYYQGLVKEDWLVLNGDLLFAWSGQKGVSFGARLWNGPEGVLNQHIFKVYENKKLLSRKFLYYLFKLNVGRIEDNAHGFKDSFVHVTRSELTDVAVMLPTTIEQELLEAKILSIESNIQIERQNLSKHKEIKKGLMQDLLTGTVQVMV